MYAASVFVLVSVSVCARTWASGLYFYREQTKWKIEKKTLVAAATRMLFSSIFELRENEHTIHIEMGDRPFALYLSLSLFRSFLFLSSFCHRYIRLTCYQISFRDLSFFLSVVKVFSSWFFGKFLCYFPFCLRQIFCYLITFVLFQASITLMILSKLFNNFFFFYIFRVL